MAQEAIRIKGNRQGLIIHLAPQSRFEDLKAHLEAKIAAAGNFLAGANFSFQYHPGTISPDQEDELAGICRQHGLVPGSCPPSTRRQAAHGSPRPKDEYPPALMVPRVLRSGQVVESSSHLVILGDVHAGAEVSAGGDILVFGTLAGSAWAGRAGNRKARILAGRMISPRLAIADVYGGEEIRSSEPAVVSVHNGRFVLEEWIGEGK